MASLTCWGRMLEEFSRSAIVRLTFNILSKALAESPNLFIAIFRSSEPEESSLQNMRTSFVLMSPFEKKFFSPANRFNWISLALITLSLTVLDDSLFISEASSLYFTDGTSIWISIRSSKGPDIFAIYFWIRGGEHVHSLFGSEK